eukprot:1159099-Pelagomonas_calceolata.AAC.2
MAICGLASQLWVLGRTGMHERPFFIFCPKALLLLTFWAAEKGFGGGCVGQGDPAQHVCTPSKKRVFLPPGYSTALRFGPGRLRKVFAWEPPITGPVTPPGWMLLFSLHMIYFFSGR